MGKKLKAWELLKLVVENTSERKFTRKRTNGSIANYKIADKKLYTMYDASKDYIETCAIKPQWEFEEVEEPVDFMTAVKAYDEGKPIRCERELYNGSIDTTRYNGELRLKDTDDIEITTVEILKGKWYVE